MTDVMAHEETLARTDFFADADPNVLASIAASGAEHHLIRGDVLFQEGDPPDAIYLVLRGRLAIAMRIGVERLHGCEKSTPNSAAKSRYTRA